MSRAERWPMDFPYPGRPISSFRRWVCEIWIQQEADRGLLQVSLHGSGRNFRRDGTIRKNTNAVKRSSETQVTAGYHMNS